MRFPLIAVLTAALTAAWTLAVPVAAADPLPSWNDTEAKARITAFVDTVTDPASADYVPLPARIAVFDNDGTLWAEQPIYFQFLFALDRLKAMGEADPSVLSSDVLRAAAAGDLDTVSAAGDEGLLEVVSTTHSGITVEAFIAETRAWIDTAAHPETGRPIAAMTYQPMLELLRYLRDEGFTTYIVSGGGVHFMRAFAAEAYNIPPQNVIGSSVNAGYEVASEGPAITKEPGVFFLDDKEGKPIAIDLRIGRRPIFAAGNSDGDFQMLEWTTAGEGARFGLIVHHTDAEREWAYDRESHVGRLERGLDEGPDRGWLIVDMARDWGRVWSD
ncbi:MAG: HAD family hydrolase [Pseudomonadota bacterium]